MRKWFRRPPSIEQGAPVGLDRWRAAKPKDIDLAYRLVLGRPADPSGLAHYSGRIRDGLSIGTMVDELLASAENQSQGRLEPPPVASATTPENSRPSPSSPGLILPETVIAQCSVRDLIETAEEYYRRIDDATPLMSKPFSYLHEAPQSLQDLGTLLGGLQLGKTMVVLDFGGGTGWLTRILIQLNCQAICCDVSASALDIGKRLFAALPPIGTVVYQPQFLLFDGHRIDLPDQSVDRVVCFDAFHHIPNQEEVLAEFARVLRPGGIVGMSEPGGKHSRSPQSQYEMKNHRVLENDIVLDDIARKARIVGLTEFRAQAVIDLPLSLEEYQTLCDEGEPLEETLSDRLVSNVAASTSNRSIFFLGKGRVRPDSRSHVGLRHEMSVSPAVVKSAHPTPITLHVVFHNTGTADWLAVNTEIFGIVRVGTHLFDVDGNLIELNYSRHELPHRIDAGCEGSLTIAVPSVGPGRYHLWIDLVAEGVSWFENLGSSPHRVELVIV
jgi:SAM-dependent methyltransferase